MNLMADISSGLFWMALVMIAGFIVVIAIMTLLGRNAQTE